MNPDGVFLSNGPGDPRSRSERRRHRQAARQGADLRHLPRPPAAGLALGGKTVQAAVRPSRRQSSGARTRVRARSRSPRRITTSPLKLARCPNVTEMTHVNLNDQALEGLMHNDEPAFSVQYHPEAGPGPHDATYLFDEFAELMDDFREGRPDAEADRHPLDPHHRLRTDRDRPGVRVRLLRNAGLPCAAGGGLPGHPRQLEPGDDHDRPGLRRRTYIEPLDARVVEQIIETEQPDALLPTLGGQTGLNLAMELDERGVLERTASS